MSAIAFGKNIILQTYGLYKSGGLSPIIEIHPCAST
jgi:hypothetical protein